MIIVTLKDCEINGKDYKKGTELGVINEVGNLCISDGRAERVDADNPLSEEEKKAVSVAKKAAKN